MYYFNVIKLSTSLDFRVVLNDLRLFNLHNLNILVKKLVWKLLFF